MQPTKRPRNLRKSPLNHEPAHLLWAIEQRHASQADLARAIGKQRPVINEYVHGTRSCPPDVLARIAEFLGCPISMLERRIRPDSVRSAA